MRHGKMEGIDPNVSGREPATTNLDRTQIETLIRQLKSPDERLRLSAASSLAREVRSDETRIALPSLKDTFLYDPNPAVKYLARKALVNQGVDPESLLRGEGLPADVEASDSSGQGVLAFQGGVRAFWRAAQQSLLPAYNALCRLVDQAPDQIVPLVLSYGEDLARDVLTPHLFELLARRQGTPSDPAASRLGELARHWHQSPREMRYPEKSDAKGAGFNQALQLLICGGQPAVAALACPSISARDQATAEQVASLLQMPESYVADAAVEVLANIGRAKRELSMKILVSAMKHFRPGEDERKLIAIARLTGALANPATLEFVKTYIKDAPAAVRAALVDAVARFHVPLERKEQLLSPLLQDKEATVMVRVMACLWGGSQQSFITYMVSRLINNREPSARRALARALGDIGKPEVMNYLVNMVRDPDDSVGSQAAESLVRLQGDGLEERFLECLKDLDSRVQSAALNWIVEHGNKDLVGAVRQGLATSDGPLTLKFACSPPSPPGMAGIGSRPDALDTSVQLTMDDDTVKVRALETLEHLNEPKVMVLIERLLLDKNPHVKGLAARTLWKFGELWVADTVRDLMDPRDSAGWGPGIKALAVMTASSKKEVELLAHPLLRTALRRSSGFPGGDTSTASGASHPGTTSRRGPQGF